MAAASCAPGTKVPSIAGSGTPAGMALTTGTWRECPSAGRRSRVTRRSGRRQMRVPFRQASDARAMRLPRHRPPGRRRRRRCGAAMRAPADPVACLADGVQSQPARERAAGRQVMESIQKVRGLGASAHHGRQPALGRFACCDRCPVRGLRHGMISGWSVRCGRHSPRRHSTQNSFPSGSAMTT